MNTKEKKVIIILFLITTILLIVQHSKSLSWDFNSYALNAKYFYSDGKYFEPLRPPLTAMIIGAMSFLGWKTAEYMYIILTASLFMYASIKLAKTLKFNPVVYYALSLNPYILIQGMINGTELLSVALLMLGINQVIEDKIDSGIWIGLSALTRYTGLVLFPIMFLHSKIKKVLLSITLFGLTLMPWLIYNFIKYGNFLQSIADQYANNILYRQYITQAMQLKDFIIVQNLLIPFFIAGVIVTLYKIKKLKDYRIEIIMIGILTYSTYSYYNIPIKNARYLFNLIIPTIYFSYVGMKKIIGKKWFATTAMIIFLLSTTITIAGIQFREYHKPEMYKPAIEKLKELNKEECAIQSNAWVMLNYLGRTSEPFPGKELVEKRIEEGKIIVMFKNIEEPSWIKERNFIESFPIIYEDEKNIILGKEKCLPIKIYEKTYVEQISEYTEEKYGYEQNKNPCFTIFHNKEFLEKMCNLINMKGFKIDENRKYA